MCFSTDIRTFYQTKTKNYSFLASPQHHVSAHCDPTSSHRPQGIGNSSSSLHLHVSAAPVKFLPHSLHFLLSVSVVGRVAEESAAMVKVSEEDM